MVEQTKDDWITPADDWVTPPASPADRAPKKQQELSTYDPTWREQFARWLTKMGAPYPVVQGLMGSQGLGHTSLGLVDITGAGAPMQAQEGLRATNRVFPSIEQQRAGAKREYNVGAIPEALEAPLAGLPFGRNVGEPVYSASKGWFTPTARATRDVARAAQRDMAAARPGPGTEPSILGSSTLGPEEMERRARLAIDSAATRGQDLTLLDVGAGTRPARTGGVTVPSHRGEETRQLGKKAANTSATAWGELDEATKGRFETSSERMIESLRRWFGRPEEGVERLAQAKEALQNAITPAYQRAYAAGDTALENAGLLQLLNSDKGREVIANAERRMEFLQRAGASSHPFTVTVAAKVPRQAPTLAYWDQVKRTMDGMISKEKDGTIRGALIMVRKRLKDWLFGIRTNRIGEHYRNALGRAAQRFDVGDAFELGQNAIQNQKITAYHINQMQIGMSSEERGWFQAGALHDYLIRIGRMNLLQRYARFPVERNKIYAILGKPAAAQFEAVLATEMVINASRRGVIGGSTTPAQAMRLTHPTGSWKDLGPHALASAILMLATQSWHAILLGAATYGLQRGAQSAARRWAEQVAKMLVSNNPAVYSRGIKEVARIPVFDNVMRHYAGRAAATTALTGAADVVGDLPGVESPENLPENPKDLQRGQWYRNKKGEVLRWDGEHFMSH